MNIEFFVHLGLVSSFQFYYGQQFGHTIDDYVQFMKGKTGEGTSERIQNAKERGQEYYNPERVPKINYISH